MSILDLEPKILWNYFSEITKVPRPSKKEEKIIAYLEKFAAEKQFQYKKDPCGNVVIIKPATPGHESKQTVILQGHVDMVCEKNSDKVFNFETDPIETIVNGDWVTANGTTLGADNGIGIAAILAVLASDVPHGKIECLFTVDEEVDLSGALNLQEGLLTGSILLNFDSGGEGIFHIGCAGGSIGTATFNYHAFAAPSYDYLSIKVNGLKGGHSGGEIHLGLGNAIKILVRILFAIKNEFNFKLASIDGGNLHNAIPREAYAVVGIEHGNVEGAKQIVEKLAKEIKIEYEKVDPDLEITVQSEKMPPTVIDDKTTFNLLHAINAVSHGVIAMSQSLPGLVETSANLASIKLVNPTKIVVGTSQRSSSNSAMAAIISQVQSTFKLAGATINQNDGYPGWSPNPDSAILKVLVSTYKDLFKKDPIIKAVHVGLECGLFLNKYPNLDIVSFAPTLEKLHSPDERVNIPSVQLWWTHLLEVLKNIPDKQSTKYFFE